MSDASRAAHDGLSAAVENASSTPVATPLRFQLYVALMLLIPALFLCSAIPIARSPSFPLESGDPFLLNPDYAFAQKNVDCDVVIYGDSTALTGLDPTVVSRATGLKTCNIAQAQSIVEILGMVALDTYLKNNAPPRYIVMQFAPETLARERNFFWEEGLTLLVRKRSILEALPTFFRHPVEAYRFSIWAIKAKVAAVFNAPVDFAATQEIFRSHGGLVVLPKPAETRCVSNVAYAQPTAGWVRALREKYSTEKTQVLVNVSPLPNCSPIATLVQAGTQSITDNSLAIFPVGLFSDMDRHLTLEGAERASMELGQQLAATRP